ncbi:type IV conjugative transfer system protein TraL [Sphingobium yanoikuyae]|nr:type IV conjugative transfer system protein TraL [Sphingobium yanoikuyae]
MASAFTHLPGVAAGASEDSFAPVELIGLWTLDEFLAMVIPFVWGIMTQHILIGMAAAFAGWWGLKKAKAGRAASWLLHLAYWHLPAGFTGLRATPPSYLRLMAG